jgi:agmatine deiminase
LNVKNHWLTTLSKRLETKPSNDGFRMPGEHEPHEAIWMAWPERTDNWRYGAKFAQQTFVEVATAISKSTPVYMAVNQSQYNRLFRRFADHVRAS